MNESSSSPNACPKCGTALPSAATAGLCPRCLMAEAMQATQTEAAPATPQKALSPAELAPHFPQLEVLECLGRGGMGVVYKVRQKSLNRFAALKLLAPERVADGKFAQRFTHEAQALAALNHPSIVTIYDFGQAGGFYFLLMEFVDGVNLRQAMKAGRFTPEQALAVVPPVCEALQYAHEHGIVHRDIKPENLLLDKDGRVKIADFGIAKMLHADSSDVGLAESQPVGTPRYMAPEQKEHRRTDHRADIYSLGVVLYELLTGEMPADKLQPPSRKVQIDVRLDEIVLRALETKPELRFQTAGEFRTQVETFDREGREEKRVDRSEKMENSQAPAPLSSSRSSLSSSPPPLLKTANSYVSTPEWLASARGKFWVYSGKGTLVLTRDQLVFTNEKTGAPVTIPLAAIRDVSLGTYPWLAKPAPLHYLSVTWEEGGLTRCRYFTPNCGWACPVWETNPLVIEWHQAVRTAVTAASGKAPAETPAPPHRPCVADFAWMGLMFGLPMLLIGAVLLHFHRMMGESNPLWKSGWFLFAAVFAVIGLVRLMRRLTRKDDSSTTSSENSDAPGSPDVGQAHTSAINPTAKSVALFCSSALLGALIWLLSPLFTGHREPWDADSPYYWLGLALAGFVPACFDAKRPWLYALGVWIGQVVAFLSLVLASAPSGGLWGIGLVMLSFYSLLGLLGALLGAGAHRLFCGHSSHADGAIGKRQPRWQGWGVGVIGICVAVFVIPPVVMMLVALLSYRQVEAPSGVTHLDLAPVGVSNNVVIVAVTIEGGRGHSELRAGLDGPPLPAATEAALAGTFSPPFAGTFIKPTPYPGNHPFRILSPGRMTWLLGFVLPDAALAKSALENLRPIGPLPSVAGRTFAGTLFEVRQTNGQVFHASLQVRPPVTAADPNWVSVSSAPSTPSASALSSYDESGRVILKWEVQASQPGIVLLHREDGQSTASLRRDPKTKLYQAGISVELTKVGTDRVLLVTSSGGILREELTGNFRDLAAELWSYKNLSAKTVRGAEIELCKFQGKPITVQVPVLTVTTASPTAPATNPGIQRVEISTDKAVVHQAHYDGSGLLITFGTGTNRWTPSGRNLDGLFNVTLEWPAFGRGSLHVIKPRHGIHMNYRLDGPPGPMVGKLVFDPGTALPDAEGFCVIGKFQPDSGEPLPLAVQLGTDQPTQPGGASIRPSAAGTSATTTAPITFRRDGVSWSFLTVGVGVIGLCVIGVVVLLVVLVRKGGTAGKVVAVLVTVPLLLLMLGVAAFVGYRWMATSSVQDAAQVASKKLGQMVLETNFPNSLVPQPRGRVLQTQNGFRVHLPAMQLASFEFLIRDADDTWRAVPALTAYVATGTNGGYHDTLTWTLRRDDKPHTENSTSQLWFWSVSATVNGGQQLPHLADHGTNFTHTLARGDQLDWSQLGIPPQTTLKPGEELLLPLFRTSGSATARGNMPKEAFVRVRCEPLPAALNLSDRDQFTELGLAAHAALAKVLPAKPLPATTPRKNAHGVSPIKSSIADGDNSPAAIAAAQKQGIASATEDIQAGVFRILAYGDLIPTSPADKDEETGFRIQWVAGSILGNAFRAEADAYNFAMREWFWKNRPGPAATVPAKNIPAVAPLIRREERGKTRDGRDFVMTFEELRRDEKTSTVTVKTVNGGSVGSAMFEVRGNWEIAKARGAAYFINLKSWQGENGQWMSLTGFAADKNVDPKTYFALKEPLPADKRLVFLSVAAYERIFKDQP